MAIRERFRRAMHKSDSSDNISQTSSNMTATTTKSDTSDDSSAAPSLRGVNTNTSRLTRPFSWTARTKSKDKEEKQREKAEKKEQKKRNNASSSSGKNVVHPRDRPLTTQNLKHQEMLSQFTMTFGSSSARMSQIVRESGYDGVYGVSPCCTRAPSIDGNDSTSLDDIDEGPGISPSVSLAEPPTSTPIAPGN